MQDGIPCRISQAHFGAMKQLIMMQVILDRTGSAASGFSQHSSSLAAGAAVHDDSNKQSDLADIEIGELLGRGSYGKVYKGEAFAAGAAVMNAHAGRVRSRVPHASMDPSHL